jgi:hypothetical protein
VIVSDYEVEAEIERGRAQYAESPRLVRYFESERGRNFIRSTLRRSRTVEKLIDDWLIAHPEHPPLPHADGDERSVVTSDTVAAVGAVEGTDPSSVASVATEEPAAPIEAVAPVDTEASAAR